MEPNAAGDLYARRSRQAAVILLASGLLIVAAISFSARELARRSAEIAALDKQIAAKQGELKHLEEELHKKSLALQAADLALTDVRQSSPAAAATVKQAEMRAFQALPEAAESVARVYLHIYDERQRPFAQQVAGELRKRGFRVPGIERVRTWRGAERTGIRLFHRADLQGDDLRLIQEVLTQKGLVPDTRLPSAKVFVPPRQFEIWFGRDTAAAARQAR
jgi:hypothetical protein